LRRPVRALGNELILERRVRPSAGRRGLGDAARAGIRRSASRPERCHRYGALFAGVERADTRGGTGRRIRTGNDVPHGEVVDKIDRVPVRNRESAYDLAARRRRAGTALGEPETRRGRRSWSRSCLGRSMRYKRKR